MIESGSRECSSSVRIRVRGRKGSNLSKFLELFCGVESFDRAWKITLPLSISPHTSIDRSRIFSFSLSLYLSLSSPPFSFGEPTNGNDRYIYFPLVQRFDKSRAISFVPRFSNRVARPILTRESDRPRDDFVSFSFSFTPFLNRHVIHVWFSFIPWIYISALLSLLVFFYFLEIVRRHFWRIYYYFYYSKDERKNSRYISSLFYLIHAWLFRHLRNHRSLRKNRFSIFLERNRNGITGWINI